MHFTFILGINWTKTIQAYAVKLMTREARRIFFEVNIRFCLSASRRGQSVLKPRTYQAFRGVLLGQLGHRVSYQDTQDAQDTLGPLIYILRSMFKLTPKIYFGCISVRKPSEADIIRYEMKDMVQDYHHEKFHSALRCFFSTI